MKEGNCYFPDTILKQLILLYRFWEHMSQFGHQIKSLRKLVSVTKGNLFVSYENW